MTDDTEIILDKKMIRAGVADPVQSAKAVNFVYVHNNQSGFSKKRTGKSFIYYDENKRIRDKTVLERI